MKKVSINPLMSYTQAWWEVNGKRTLFKKDSWVEVSESTWNDMKKYMKPMSDNMQGQVFIAEDESIDSKQVVERFDISDKVEVEEVVEEDLSADWFKSEEE
jgi:Holliday junction resolvase RusA-like endonuclease